jgi:hypothetical protein
MSRAKSPPVPARPFSRLHEICGGLMEACWLAAVVLVPLAYNPHGIAAFQPFKMACFRLLAAVLAAAWVVRRIEAGPSAKRPPATPLVVVLGVAIGLLALAH